MVEVNNTSSKKIDSKKLKEVTEAWLREQGREDCLVSIALINQEKMKSLNFTYRGLDRPTDVLSFPVSKEGLLDEKYLGEVLINLDEVEKTDKYLDVFKEEKPANYILYFLLIHGLLHLVGYCDETEEGRQEMIALGSEFLKKQKVLIF